MNTPKPVFNVRGHLRYKQKHRYHIRQDCQDFRSVCVCGHFSDYLTGVFRELIREYGRTLRLVDVFIKSLLID